MKDQIVNNLENPGQLERMYREDKHLFKKEFNAVYPGISERLSAKFWHERLNYSGDDLSWGSRQDLIFVVAATFIAGIIAKLPAFFSLDEEFFYTRNVGFIIFPVLTVYFALRRSLSAAQLAILGGVTLVSVIFINSFPDNPDSDTLTLSCMHLLLVLWSVLGFAFAGGQAGGHGQRLSYLKYNGDLIVICALLGIAGVILSGITIGLFSLIGLNIEEFYFRNIAIFLLPGIPILGTYLTQTNPQLVGKVSPVIARIFSPLVLVMLVVYLIAIVYQGKDPYNDRDFLLIFNALLVGVMAIIFFSIAGKSGSANTPAETGILLVLSVVTIVVNCIALSAILFRISEWGMTPNRAAVLGGNVLILINLFLVTTQFFKVVSKKSDLPEVGRVIAGYLPVYPVWAAVVTFLFPLLFGYR